MKTLHHLAQIALFLLYISPLSSLAQSDSTQFEYGGDQININFGDEAPSSQEGEAKSKAQKSYVAHPKVEKKIVTTAYANAQYVYKDPPASRVPSLKLIESINSRVPGEVQIAKPKNDDATYKARLSAITQIIPLDYNPEVRTYIDLYVTSSKGREQLKQVLAKSDLYFPIFEEALDRYNLPIELKYLPVIISALLPNTKSENGNSGLWQLPYGTAKLYGLETNSYIDERRDPRLSTEAAARHLSALYKQYRDWLIVIAAYCAGEGDMNQALHRAGGHKDYWTVASFLPAEVQPFVPMYIAAAYALNYHAVHDIYKYNAPYNFYSTDTVRVHQKVSLKDIAQHLGMPHEELQFLNPAIKYDIIPASKRGYPLVVPSLHTGLVNGYLGNQVGGLADAIIVPPSQATVLPPNNILNATINEYGIVKPQVKDPTTIRMANVRHIVVQGETLSTIAEKYNCREQDLRNWNDLSSNKLSIGQELIIVKDADVSKVYENISARRTPLPANFDQEPIDVRYSRDRYEWIDHQVLPDQKTFEDIAKIYQKVKVEDIKYINGIETMPPSGTIIKVPMPKR